VVDVPVLELGVVDVAREVLSELTELVFAIAPLKTRLAHAQVPFLDRVADRVVRRGDDPRPGVMQHQCYDALRVRGSEHGAELAPG
jgi:hypothetical protein